MSQKKFLSYKEWREMNENFGLVSMGVSSAPSVGGMTMEEIVNGLDVEGLEMLEEACKKAKAKKKKMLGDGGEPKPLPKDVPDEKPDVKDDKDEDEEDEEGDEGEEVEDEPEPEEGDEDVEKKPDIEGKPDMKKPMPKPDVMMSKKKSKKKMTKEEREWHDSLKSQLASIPNQKNWDGFSEVPEAGQPGFAPSGRIGWFQ